MAAAGPDPYLDRVSCVAVSWCMASGSNQAYYVSATGALSAVTARYAPGG